MRKLGEVVEHAGQRYVVTHVFPDGEHAEMTSIPEGMTAGDLGRKFHSPLIDHAHEARVCATRYSITRRPSATSAERPE